jgi:hypothetical protein
MQSRRPDANLSPVDGRPSPAGPDVDVIVLTTDLELLAILQDASGPEHILWHAQSTDETVELLVDGRCGVLIADLQDLRGAATALLVRLQLQFPELVLLAMGRREEENSIGPLVTSGRVYRFLHKPVSPARASLFISTAARRHVELSNTASPAMAAVRHFTQPAHKATFLGFLVGLAALAAIWWLREPIERLAGQLSPPPKSAAQETTPLIEERLAAARRALMAGRMAPPQSDSALESYRGVLALQGDNQEALAGVTRIIAALEKKFLVAIDARDTPKAAAAFSALQNADPEHPRLEELRQQLLTLSRGKTTKKKAAK